MKSIIKMSEDLGLYKREFVDAMCGKLMSEARSAHRSDEFLTKLEGKLDLIHDDLVHVMSENELSELFSKILNGIYQDEQ